MTDCIAAKARVLAVQADGRLTIELVGQKACPGCRCGRLALIAGERWAEVSPDASMLMREGDEVSVEIPAESVLRGALWLYGLPLTGVLAGAAAAAAVESGDLGCLAGALVGLGGALLLLRQSRQRRHGDAARGLRVVRIA